MKRFIAALLVGLMVFNISGCRSLTPKEQMKKILNKQWKMVSLEADMNGQYALDLSRATGSTLIPEEYQEALKNMTVTGHLLYTFALADLPQLGFQLEAGIKGVRFAYELYIKNSVFYIKYPMFSNYISTTLDGLYEAYTQSVESDDQVVPQDALESLMKLVSKRFYEKWGALVIDAIDEKELIYTPKWIVEEAGIKKTYQKIGWTPSLESSLNILKALLADMRTDEEFYQAVMDLQKEPITFTEYQTFIDEMMTGIVKSYQHMGENKTADQYKVTYTLIYNNTYQLQYLENNIQVDTVINEAVGAVAVNYFMKIHFYNQNKLRGVEYPDFTPQNSTRLLDLLKQ